MSEKLVYLLRHAKSSWDHPELADHERPLSPRGVKAARRMAERMRRDGVVPALVLCSSARRARETLEPIEAAFGSKAAVRVEDNLYGASADHLLDRLRRVADSVLSVMIIGHNPGVQELAVRLLSNERGRSELMVKFPTAALATLRVNASRWRELDEEGAELVAFLKPRNARQ
jgi:phosphohistidine phosphatase